MIKTHTTRRVDTLDDSVPRKLYTLGPEYRYGTKRLRAHDVTCPFCSVVKRILSCNVRVIDCKGTICHCGAFFHPDGQCYKKEKDIRGSGLANDRTRTREEHVIKKLCHAKPYIVTDVYDRMPTRKGCAVQYAIVQCPFCRSTIEGAAKMLKGKQRGLACSACGALARPNGKIYRRKDYDGVFK